MRKNDWMLGSVLGFGVALAACASDDKTGNGADANDVTTVPDGAPDTADSAVDSATAEPETTDDAGDGGDGVDDADTTPCPGCPQSPCESNEDCLSGFCLDGPSGLECAATCEESCPAGYGCKPIGNAGGDPTFVCVSDHVTFCQPCRTDGDCELGFGGVTGARCLEGAPGAGSFCRTRCTPGSCPVGATCEEVVLTSGTESLCKLDAGECACSARAITRGAETDCGLANEFGTCAGVRTCEAEGLTACDAGVAAAEVCNDLDDNCDGKTDEAFADKGKPCDGEDSDKCLDGTWVCAGDGTAICTDDASSKVELCNGLDDDCDATTDEDFAQLGLGCDGSDDDKCANGTWACDAAGLGVVCDETVSAVSEICDGLDNDCDDATDEDFAGLGAACDSADDTDQCKDGKVACAADGLGTACDDDAQSVVELCNGEDDDCDTAVDEGFESKNQTCDGIDADGCKDGFLVCSVDGSGLVCNDDGSSRVELCNELDDDCSGTPDDAWPDKLKACDGPDADKCADGIYVCTADGSGLGCTDDGVSHLEVCNDVDDDCDGDTDEDYPTKGTPCDSEVDTDLCNGGVWECGAGGGVVCGDDAASIAEACNGSDDDCDGKVDTEDPDLVAPLNANQQGLCAGTHQTCGGVSGWANDYAGVAGFGTVEKPDAAYLDENCDGLDGDATQVFVAKSGTNAGTCTKAAPCLTINFAVGKTSASRNQVYVQAGTYDEIVELAATAWRVEIYGGFNTSWGRRPRTEAGHKVTIRGAKHATDAEYMTVRARSATAKFADLYLEAKSPGSTEWKNGRGLSSYVVHAVSSTLTLERVEVVQGNGATGDVGAAGTDAATVTAPTKAEKGGDGTQESVIFDQAQLCNITTRGVGGVGRTNAECSSGTAGGRGGSGGTMDTSCVDLFIIVVCEFLGEGNCDATAGQAGTSGAGNSASAGSAGAVCGNPGDGRSGSTTSHGGGGSAGTRGGGLSSNYWSGGDGGTGTLGAHGTGGGGGGGSGGCDDGDLLQNSSGAGGGGGGAGGCRAQTAGAGGKAGGASFGVFTVGGSVTLDACRFVQGNGGAGGVGGAGGRGQTGGDGGDPGNAAGTAKAGGAGGDGGDGGASGGGGGGGGGSSFGLFTSGGATTNVSADTEFSGGAFGGGGAGGTAQQAAGSNGPGKKGGDGIVDDIGTCAAAGACGF